MCCGFGYMPENFIDAISFMGFMVLIFVLQPILLYKDLYIDSVSMLCDIA